MMPWILQGALEPATIERLLPDAVIRGARALRLERRTGLPRLRDSQAVGARAVA